MVELKIIIQDNKIEEFKRGFYKVAKKPEGFDDIPFIQGYLRGVLFAEYKRGKEILARENISPEIDEGVLS